MTILPAAENTELTPFVDAIRLDAESFARFPARQISGRVETGGRVDIESRSDSMQTPKAEDMACGPTALTRGLVALGI